MNYLLTVLTRRLLACAANEFNARAQKREGRNFFGRKMAKIALMPVITGKEAGAAAANKP